MYDTPVFQANSEREEKKFCHYGKSVYFCTRFQQGRLAEGLGTGLQNLLLRFKSGSDLTAEGQRRQDAVPLVVQASNKP